jgi:hypothetical protein
VVSICATQSTFLKTSLTTNTIFQLAKDKEMFLASSACLPQDQAACGGVIAVPTSAWRDITFIKDQQEGMDVVARIRVREGDINTYMEVKTLTQLHRLEMINP